MPACSQPGGCKCPDAALTKCGQCPLQFHRVCCGESDGSAPDAWEDLAKVFPALSADRARVAALKGERPTYLVRAGYARIESGLNAEEKTAALAAWWAAEAAALPAWSALAADVFLLVPSSCAVERVFSVMRDTFDKQQRSAHEDYLETSIMLQYNRRPGSANQ